MSLRERRASSENRPGPKAASASSPPAMAGFRGGVDVLDPVSTNFLNASCDKATFGGPCDTEIERVRDAFAKETDPARQKAIAEAISVRAAEYPTHVPLGQCLQPTAYRKSITGLLVASNIALWNVDKK